RPASALHAAPRGHRRGGVAAPRARARAGLPPGARRRGDPPRRQDPGPRRHVCGAHRPADLAAARPPARGDPRHRPREARVLPVRARQGAALRGLGLSAGHARALQHRRHGSRHRREPQPSAPAPRRDHRRRQGPASPRAEDDRPRRGALPLHHRSGRGGRALVAQYEMNLRDYWMIIRRRRVIIITATVLVAGLSFWIARQKVPNYQATAAVKFEQSTQMSGLLVEVLSYSSADSIETQVTLIKSYPILEDVAKRLGRLPQTASGEAMRESKGYWAALDSISERLKIARIPNTSILEITATSTNPREVRDLANAVAEAYRDYSKSLRNLRVTEARRFIENQLREVEGRVKRAENDVWAFREANRIIAPGAESTVLLSIFTQVRGDIEKARQQRTELEVMQQRLSR